MRGLHRTAKGEAGGVSEPVYWFDDHHTHAGAAVFLLTKDRRLILQLRDDKPGVNYPGRIGAFGGSAEHGETPADCALRELAEETGLQAAADDLHRLGAVSMIDPQGNRRASVFFLLRDVDPDALTITEGTAIVLSCAEAAADPRL